MAVTHSLSATTPDDPTYEIRPSHWNAAHVQHLTLTGNTAGVSTLSGTNFLFSGAPNVTLSGVQGADVATVGFSGGAGAAGNTGYVSAGIANASLGTLSIADGNGISFGVNGQTLTATVKTDYQSSNANYLTSQSNQNVTAANGGFAFQTLSFSNVNGFSFGTSAGSAITGSYTVPTQSTQPVAASGSNGSFNFSTLSFGNSNGLSLYSTNGSIVGSYTVPTVTNSSWTVSDNATSISVAQLAFTNLNGMTLSLSTTTGGSATVVGSYTVPTVPAQFSGGNSNLGNAQGDTGVVTGRLVLVGTNNITLSGSTNGGSMTISISGGAGAAGNTGYVSAGTTHASLGTLSIADGNGISFGVNGQTLTATVKTDYLTSQSNQALSGSNGSFAFQTATFGNLNGMSFYTSNGSMVGSYTVPTQTVQPVAASGSNGSFNFSTITFGNSNGLTFYTTNGSMVGSYTVPNVPAQTDQTVGGYFVGNTTGQSSSSTWDARTISFDGAGIVSIGASAGSIRISATQSNQAFSADASSTFQTLTLQNSNGISFSNNAGAVRLTHDLQFTSNTSAITSAALHTSVGGRIYVTAQSTGQSSSSSYDLRTLSIVPDGIISAGWSGGSFRISATQSNQAFSADASSTFQTLSFQNSNGFTFSNNAGAIRASYTRNVASNAIQSVGSATGSGTNTSRFAADDHVHAGVFSMGVSNLGNTVGDTRVDVGRFVLQGGNNVTLSQITAANALNTIIVSGGAGGAGMSAGVSGGNTSNHSGTVTGQVVFAGGNNITLSGSTNGGSMSVTISAFTQSNPAVSNSAGSFTFQTLNFSNANNVTWGTSVGGIVTASVAAPGAAAENNNINLLGVNTSGNTTASGSTIGLSGINMTLSGTNNSVINLSVPATSSLVGTSGISVSSAGSTISIQQIAGRYFANFQAIPALQTLQPRQSTSYVFPFDMREVEAPGYMRMLMSFGFTSTSFASTANTSYSYNLAETHNLVLYTRGSGASSLSLQSVFSTSNSIGFSWRLSRNATNNISVSWAATYPISSGTSSISSSYAATNSSDQYSTTQFTAITGLRFLDHKFSTTLDGKMYWLAYGVSTTQTTNGTANLSNARMQNSLHCVSQLNSNVARFGEATNSSIMLTMGLGSFTTNAIATTASIPLANISSQASQLVPYIQLVNGMA